MNLKSEQIRPDLSLDIAYDEPLSKADMIALLNDVLGIENCFSEIICNHKVLVYKNSCDVKIVLLFAACTYLGGNGQHPVFKKRIQLRTSFKEVCENLPSGYDAKFIGIYHYQGLIIFVDFEKETYLTKKMHNSAAHVYINDLYQAIVNNEFSKRDAFGNTIHTISSRHFKEYLDGVSTYSPITELLDLFKKFNYGFPFGEWLTAVQCIQEMHDRSWKHWRQTEWPGFFLEYIYYGYVSKNRLEPKMEYMGLLPKKEREFDFDVWFNETTFFGDLKASDITKKIAPGNDQDNFLECINKYGRFWYIIYEHQSVSDKNCNGEAEKFRKQLILEDDPSYYLKRKNKSNSSNHRFIDNRVYFDDMMIIELNRFNYHEVLTDFNQGRQPGGGGRAKKFNINKRNIDNFVMLRYKYGD